MDMNSCSGEAPNNYLGFGSEEMVQIEGKLVGPILVAQMEELHYHVFLVVHTNVDRRNYSLEASHKLSFLKNIFLFCFTVHIKRLDDCIVVSETLKSQRVIHGHDEQKGDVVLINYIPTDLYVKKSLMSLQQRDAHAHAVYER